MTVQDLDLIARAKGLFARPSLLSRFSRRNRDRDALQPAYQAVVARARDPFWYRDGQVPDTLDGRFDMLSAFMAMTLIRLEVETDAEIKAGAVMLTELFVDDMDRTLHQIGIGDYVVGKHVGNMMGALGGRLGAFRAATQDRDFAGPVRRNIFHDAPPSDESVALIADRLERFDRKLLESSAAEIVAGRLPDL